MRLDDELQQMTGELIDAQDQLLALYGLARATRRRLSLDAVLTELVAEVRRLTGADVAFAALAESAGGSLVMDPSGDHTPQATLWRAFDWVSRLQTPLVANSTGDLPSELESPISIENLVVVPVSVDGEPRATLGVVNRRDTTFSAGTVKLLQAIGEHAGALVEAALLHEQALVQQRLRHDMELAATLQSGLMADTPPLVREWRWSVDSVRRRKWGVTPITTSSARGRTVDIQRGRRQWQGSVSGKGLSAALIMGMSRNVLRGTSQLLDRPSAVMEQVNAALYDDLNRVHTFVTAFVGYYDPAQRVVRFANAGHSPVVYCAAGESPRMLPATSLPLGVFEDSSAADECVRMAAGDVLVVGTDGFSEATSASGATFGYERLDGSLFSSFLIRRRMRLWMACSRRSHASARDAAGRRPDAAGGEGLLRRGCHPGGG